MVVAAVLLAALPLVALARRRRALLDQARGRWGVGLSAGVLSVAAYGLVLWAQTVGALASIAALRESSIIWGAVIATVFFKEPFGRVRIAASAGGAGGHRAADRLGPAASLVRMHRFG